MIPGPLLICIAAQCDRFGPDLRIRGLSTPYPAHGHDFSCSFPRGISQRTYADTFPTTTWIPFMLIYSLFLPLLLLIAAKIRKGTKEDGRK